MSLDDVLAGCREEALLEMRELMKKLNPEEDMLPSEIVGIVGILRGAQKRRNPPPPGRGRPAPRSDRPHLVRIA
jgi:hypothetical protein